MNTHSKGMAAAMALAAFAPLSSAGAQQSPNLALAQQLPNLVLEPGGLNYGGTSFFDGFAPPIPGFVFTQTGRLAAFNRIVDGAGHDAPAFNNPKITTLALVNQVVYTTPLNVGPTLLGFTGILPVLDIGAHFDAPGLALRSAGAGFGDATFGPFLQSFPIMSEGRPIFAYRFEMDVTAPTGRFDATKDFNPSSGFWSISPNLAMTYFPAPKWEVSARLNYIYNFQTTRMPNPPPIPFFKFQNGQAGQMAWVNMAASYGLTAQLDIGANAFYSAQLTENKLNGVALHDTRETQLYAGPGLRYAFNPTNILDVNIYAPILVRNVAAGPQVNVHYIHAF